MQFETDLAELIIQLAGERSSHILVPAIHKNRAEIRTLFMKQLGVAELSDEPRALAAAARAHLRRKFLGTSVAVSGANFAVSETGTVCIVESEGNGRMCLTLPRVLISVMGLEKVIPSWQDFEVFLQLLPRSSTGERMNPYTSFWTGMTPGDGPEEFHLILLDNGRTRVLEDPVGRQALLHPVQACLNICPVYERTGGHAYQSVYPGPIGAILTPQLAGVENAPSLPYASSLCGAVPRGLPGQDQHPRGPDPPAGAGCPREARPRRPACLARSRSTGDEIPGRRFRRKVAVRAQKLGRFGQRFLMRGGFIEHLPGPLAGWTAMCATSIRSPVRHSASGGGHDHDGSPHRDPPPYPARCCSTSRTVRRPGWCECDATISNTDPVPGRAG